MAENTRREFGLLLRRIRIEAQWNIAQLAAESRLDCSYITRLESSTDRHPSAAIIDKLCETLGASPLDWDRLRVLAGHVPRSVIRSGWWESEHLLSRILGYKGLSHAEKVELDAVLQSLLRNWQALDPPMAPKYKTPSVPAKRKPRKVGGFISCAGQLLSILREGPARSDELNRRTQRNPNTVRRALNDLRVQGLLCKDEAGYWRVDAVPHGQVHG